MERARRVALGQIGPCKFDRLHPVDLIACLCIDRPAEFGRRRVPCGDALEPFRRIADARHSRPGHRPVSNLHDVRGAPDLYDDGGFSGGSLERAGLKRLRADIEAGWVDTIIVYKVDRLTRSLADFAKTVDVLDAAGASFVSITQSFNTTTSMQVDGRAVTARL